MKVVESVMAAQRSLQSVLAIRDKAVSAYQEIAAWRSDGGLRCAGFGVEAEDVE